MITNTYAANPFEDNSALIAASNSSFLSATSLASTVLICATISLSAPKTNSLASREIRVLAVLSVVDAPALSIARPYSSAFTSAIFANSSAATLSCKVHVGDLNNNESEIIADNINPAICLSMLTFCSS